MKAISLKLNTYAKSVANSSAGMEHIIFKFLVSAFGALAIFYILILANLVLGVIERRSLETSARDLETQVGELELRYLSLTNSIDLPMSYSMGFREAKASFVSKDSSFGLNSAVNTRNGI